MSKIADTEANATSLDGLVNDNGLITTLRNGPKPSWQYIVDQVYAQLGYAVVGSFVTGFTYTGIRQVGVDASGNTWIYTGGQQNIPHVVPPSTVPSDPEYFQVSVNSADNVVLDNGENLQQAIDRLNDEINDLTASDIANSSGGSVQDYIDNIPTEYDLFIIYGQSNPVGFAGNTPGRQSIPEHSYFWQNRNGLYGWQKLIYDMPYVSITTSTGHAWVEFAREYTKRTGRGCLFLPAAYGGTTITELSSGGVYFNYLETAINEIKADTTYNIRATRMLWHQGESDMTEGTTRSEYLSLFVTLWNDIKALIGASHCYIAKVGNPQTRPEPNRYAIQVAQDYLAYNVNDISMAFDGCGSFTIADDTLRPDGTHYTQKGYNLMGLEMAKVVASREVTASSSSQESNTLKGYISTPSDQAHRAVGATLIHDGTDFVLKSISDGGRYRSSFVQAMTINGSQIILDTSCNTDDIITMQIGVNDVGVQEGITATIRDGGTSGKLVINLYADTQAVVDTSDGTISYPPYGSSKNTGLLSDLSATVTGAGITQLSFTSHPNVATVSPIVGGLLDEYIPIRQTAGSDNNIWFKYETTPTVTKALVSFTRKPLNPSALLLNGLQLNVWCVLGDRSL